MNTPPVHPGARRPQGPVLTRRQALRAAAITAGVAVMAPTVVATADAGTVAGSTAAPIRLRDLPLMYGTPTDLARTAAAESETVWTFDSEGVVLSYDRDGDFWSVDAHQDWATVLTFGTVRLARWGRPSGANQMVLVFGSAIEPPPTTPPGPTTDPTGTITPTTPTAPSSSSTVAPTSIATTTTPTAGSRQYAAPAGGSGSGGSTSGSTADGELSYTGLNLGRPGLIAAGLLTAGGALLAVRRRRMAHDPDPASQAAPSTDSRRLPDDPAPG